MFAGVTHAREFDVLSLPAVDDQIISLVNSDPSSTWRAGHNEKFSGLTRMEARRFLGARLDDFSNSTIPRVVLHAVSIPDSFDSRKQWSNCVFPVRDQQQCGSCWAFGAAEALTDRLCIATQGAQKVVLSTEDLVSCDKSNYGCNGGYLNKAWQYLEDQGTVSDSCFPYTAGHGVAPPCRTTCIDGSTPIRYKVQVGSIIQPSDMTSIQTEILNHGPVEAGFSVYQDFFSYKSGVYQHKSGSLQGGHAIKIVGWGVDGSTPYWIVQNSWGTSWGMNGFFWILRGHNECGIERNVVAGAPVVSH